MSPYQAPLQPSLARRGIPRAAAERADPELIPQAREDASTRVLLLHEDTAPLRAPEALRFLAPADVPDDAMWALLGRDERGPVLAAVLRDGAPRPFEGEWGPLRVIGASLPAADAELLVTAVSLGRWLRDAAFCPNCGARCELLMSGWMRRCPNCGRAHFPRTDPAVIVAIDSAADPDRLLLGANAAWGGRRYSCFAGFVEAGESLESAVERELAEEANVRVRDIRYRGSQAWPYPRSLMLGFRATAVADDDALPDGDEIISVRWFTRDEIGAGLRGEGDIGLPGPASIAHALISEWHAETR
ncbi:NAD(+) diphosphatase [Microbacterium candidum]|uniref:NAD(+) diphosphatase n=1 Tax=Microbacterium candidum TaxID=3041922 RepID=A0ABT7N2F3_9MICO|nr:NAD(+) diphosphatase [Microbacterium sp. ASV49]MDL9980890.1 NAD(+) diphosphatase [Microbacterium sp. ASV49]